MPDSAVRIIDLQTGFRKIEWSSVVDTIKLDSNFPVNFTTIYAEGGYGKHLPGEITSDAASFKPKYPWVSNSRWS